MYEAWKTARHFDARRWFLADLRQLLQLPCQSPLDPRRELTSPFSSDETGISSLVLPDVSCSWPYLPTPRNPGMDPVGHLDATSSSTAARQYPIPFFIWLCGREAGEGARGYAARSAGPWLVQSACWEDSPLILDTSPTRAHGRVVESVATQIEPGALALIPTSRFRTSVIGSCLHTTPRNEHMHMHKLP
jgi:hypothetical protein